MTERLLGLPVSSRRWTTASALALFVFYAATMCRSLSMYDSPELALVAEQFGLGHPFGQPLHTMLGGILANVPGVNPLLALNGLSALAGALTVIPATSFADALLRPSEDCPDGDARLIAPTIALLGAHPVLWEPSTRVEVYALATFFALWAAARFVHAILDEDASGRPYFASGLALGLSASANVICAVGVAFAMTPRLLIGKLRGDVPRGAVVRMIQGGLLGLLAYAYVFLVGGRKDVLVWGAPNDLASIKHYFTAADFSYKHVQSWSEWFEHLGDLLWWSVRNGLFAIWLAGLVGFFLYARKRGLGRLFFNAALLFFLAFVARNGVFAPDVLDFAGYLAVPTWIAASGAAVFVAYLAARHAWGAAAAFSAALILVMVAPPAPHARTRHLDTFTYDIASGALEGAPEGAILIVKHDHWVAPLMYLQEQRGVRPDVAVLVYGLASSEWHWDLLYRRHPDLTLIELRAPGGRLARVRRFLEANSGRPVQVDGVALAGELGLPTCPSEWLLDVATRCRQADGEPALARLSGAALATLGHGSPGTDGLIALLTLLRGHDLYSQGLPRVAIATLLAGVPRIEGLAGIDLGEVPSHVDPRPRPTPSYEPRVALGHPAQNLHYASLIARAAGATGLGVYLADLAEAMGPVEPKFATLPPAPDNL